MRYLWSFGLAALLAALCLGLQHSGLYLGRAAQLLPGFHETRVAAGLERPTSFTFAPDGRIFITEQAGRIRIVEKDVLVPDAFFSVETHSFGGQGLFNIAFDPAFIETQWAYIYYVTPPPRRARLVRVTAQGNRIAPNSQVTLLETEPLPPPPNHLGGSPIFDADGLLYLGVGDSTEGASGQALDTLFGKVLRLTREGMPAPNNPFLDHANARPEIFAYGFRNPYKLARNARTDEIFVNDVGENSFEEINRLERGANYGWSICEGNCQDARGELKNPRLSYQHGNNMEQGCAITGGAFYQPARAQFPSEYMDHYFFADLCGGWIRVLDPATNLSSPFASGLGHIVDLQVNPNGALYYLSRGIGADFYNDKFPGQLWRIEYVSPP